MDPELSYWETSDKLAGSTLEPVYRACGWYEDKNSSDGSEGFSQGQDRLERTPWIAAITKSEELAKSSKHDEGSDPSSQWMIV